MTKAEFLELIKDAPDDAIFWGKSLGFFNYFLQESNIKYNTETETIEITLEGK